MQKTKTKKKKNPQAVKTELDEVSCEKGNLPGWLK